MTPAALFPGGCPERILDHAAERREALGRFEAVRSRAVVRSALGGAEAAGDDATPQRRARASKRWSNPALG